MSTIGLFEPELEQKNQFFRYLFMSLRTCAAAKPLNQPRPSPQVLQPRMHESAWVQWKEDLLFFDMSDHVFSLDLEALKRCTVYFKANLHRGVADRVLRNENALNDRHKLVPFLFLPPAPEHGRHMARFDGMFSCLPVGRFDVTHVVGVYENLVRDGQKTCFEPGGEVITPARYHFWIRYHTQQALRQAGVNGLYRLTSRGYTELEDGQLVHPNQSHYHYLLSLLRGRLTVINTLPHALLPWKATESISVGRPFVVERAPLVEFPAPMAMKAGEHYLELLPEHGQFDGQAPLEDPSAYRVLQPVSLSMLNERAAWLGEQLCDRALMAHMMEAVRAYRDRTLRPQTVVDYIAETVETMR